MTAQEYLINKYGMRMTITEIIAELKTPYDTLMQKRSRGTLGFKTYKDGVKVYAATTEVAAYLDSKQAQAV